MSRSLIVGGGERIIGRASVSRRARTLVTLGFVGSGLIMLAELAHEREANQRLEVWAEGVIADTHAPNPITFVSHTVGAVRRCFSTEPTPGRAEPHCTVGLGMFVYAPLVAIPAAVHEMPDAGVLGTSTAAIALVLAGIIALGMTMGSDSSLPAGLGWAIRFALIALLGIGPALWLIGHLMQVAARVAGGIAGLITFIAANALLLHFGLWVAEVVHHLGEHGEEAKHAKERAQPDTPSRPHPG